MDKIEIGSVVISKAGRDCGELYLVYAITGEKLSLVNGHARKIQNPKIKSVKHLIVTNQKLNVIAEKIAENKKIFDSEIYSALKRCTENLENDI